MHPLVILAIGVVIVIGGILLLRLHAFLALTLAALVVGLLTPLSALERYSIEQAAVKPYRVEAGELLVEIKKNVKPSTEAPAETERSDLQEFEKKGFYPSMTLLVMRAESSTSPLEQIGKVEFDGVRRIPDPNNAKKKPEDERDILVAFARPIAAAPGDEPPVLKKGDVFIEPSAATAAVSAAKSTVGERVASGFGSTAASIGILIAMAAIIGKCLLDSGAADKIVRSAMRVTGEAGAPIAFLFSGFLLGIPVFFDTVFYLMIPLGKALQMRLGRNYLLFVLSIVAGATMAHSLVPPTPGPLLVAGELGVDLGLMILAGCLVGMCSSTAGYLFARFANSRAKVPLRESPDFSLKDMQELADRDESQLPPLVFALMPIVLPVVLIAGFTVIKTFKLIPSDNPLFGYAETLGNKNIALTIAAGIAMLMLIWNQRTSLKDLAKAMQAALASGGVIILITAAGGAFGNSLKQTGVAGLIGDLPQQSTFVVLILAFLITTAIRTAQGSATVAMITAVGVLTAFAQPGVLGCHPVYLALAIGCGSKPIAWMNDSGFWVICKMSGMTEAEGLRFVTPMSILMGVVGLGATLVGAWLLPMSG